VKEDNAVILIKEVLACKEITWNARIDLIDKIIALIK